MSMQWRGVLPALTTCFREDFSIDHEFAARHCNWLIDNGCSGIIALGSIGEAATMSHDEKVALLDTCVRALGDRAPVAAGISSLSTRESVELAQAAEKAGCKGLMVLPPYVYSTDWREMKAHVAAIISATSLPCLLYNNPVAYGTDFLPEQIAELASEHSNVTGVKESSTDVRRVTAIRSQLGERLDLCVGVDDTIVEGIRAGAIGWVAGLVNALPRESVKLFELATAGERERADELYAWFLPLLRLDTVPKLVQLIKMTQEAVGMGTALCRPPRLPLVGAELEQAQEIIRTALANRPNL
ncbi:MAG: dihydrodipicolinate synthase family protein [Myxococcales bacterium FL481]|nr:MAG: dihydrodipicolinate synthase family protein [Myxococcales bacterium FL481]